MEKVAVVYRFPEGWGMDDVDRVLTEHEFYNHNLSISDREENKYSSGFLYVKHSRGHEHECGNGTVFVEAKVGTRLESFLSDYEPSETK